MRHVTFYHKDSGVLHPNSLVVSDEALIALNTPAEHVPIEQPEGGAYDPHTQRIDPGSGRPVFYKPPTDHAAREAEDAARRQARMRALESQQHRAVREALLGVLGGFERLRKIEEEITALRAAQGTNAKGDDV